MRLSKRIGEIMNAKISDIELTERTKVPLSTVFSLGGLLIAFVFWLTVMYSKVNAAEAKGLVQDQKQEQIMTLLLDTNNRLIRIETKLDNHK